MARLWDLILHVFSRYSVDVVAERCQILVLCVLLAIYEDFVDSAILYVFYEVFGAMRVFSPGVRFPCVLSYYVAACSPLHRSSAGLLGCHLAFGTCF